MNAVDEAWLTRRMGDGSTTIEGSLAEIHLDEVLMSLAEAPHRFELAITCPDGRVARIDVGSGQVLAARLGEERDPLKVLATLTHLQPEGFRLRPLREPLVADERPVGAIPELIAQAMNLAEELPTIVEWDDAARDRTAAMEAEEELKPTELVSREALAERVGLARVGLEPHAEIAQSPEPPTQPGLVPEPALLTQPTEPFFHSGPLSQTAPQRAIDAPIGLVPDPGMVPEPELPTEPGPTTVGRVPTAELLLITEGPSTSGRNPTADILEAPEPREEPHEVLADPPSQEAAEPATSWEAASLPPSPSSAPPAPSHVGLTFAQLGLLGTVFMGFGFLAGLTSAGALALIVVVWRTAP